MKNSKYILAGSILTFIILIIFAFININDSRKEIIYVKDLESYTKTITEFQNRVDKIKNEECKQSIQKYADKINKTHFDKDVTVEDYYNAYYKDDKDTIKLYTDIENICDYHDDKIYEIVLEANIFPTEIKNKYNLSYEFSINDKMSRKLVNINHDNLGTYSTKILELKALDEIIKKVTTK